MTNDQATVVQHHSFEIPRTLAARTGTLPNFREVSDQHMTLLREHGNVDAARNIIEIGCGVGRDAIAIAETTDPSPRYLGIDVMRPSIEWASENITPRYPDFRFSHIDVKDDQHNPDGTGGMDGYVLPAESAETDLVFMFSVFTHMFPDDVRTYLREFARVLRPDGLVLTTLFVVDDDLRRHLVRIGGGGLRKVTFEHEIEPGAYHRDPKVVPGATAYSLDWFKDAAADCGLSVKALLKGSWAFDGRFEVRGQDVMLLARA